METLYLFLFLIIFVNFNGPVVSDVNYTLLTVAVEQWVPFVLVFDYGGDIEIKGPMAEVLKVLTDKLYYKYRFVKSVDGQWGRRMSNGSWTGMMGMVHRQEVDFAVGPFFASREREDAVDFSSHLLLDSQSIVMQRPGLYNDVFGFLKPFPNLVYLGIFLSLIAMAVTYKLIVSFEEKVYQENPKDVSFLNSFLWATRTLAQEASDWYPQTDGSKIVITTWLLGTFIVMKAYEGILTAMITVPKVEIPIDSLEDLANQNEVPWKLEVGTMVYQYFQQSTTPVERKIFEEMNGTFTDCFSGCPMITRGEFAGVCDFTTIKKCMHWDFSTHNKCNAYVAKSPVFPVMTVAMAFQTNSTIKLDVDIWIVRLHQAGLFDKWLKNEVVNASQCLTPPGSESRVSQSVVLKLENFSGLFLLLVLGNSVATLAFVLEIFWKNVAISRSENLNHR